jgi:hypothetical protein
VVLTAMSFTANIMSQRPIALINLQTLGPLDLDKQCGVISEINNMPCTRSLTCKTHSMSLKRAVKGRSQPYDVLYAAYQARAQALRSKLICVHCFEPSLIYILVIANGGVPPPSASRNRAQAASAASAAAAAAAAAASAEQNQDAAIDVEEELEVISQLMQVAPPQPLAVKPRPGAYAKRRRECFRMREMLVDALCGRTLDLAQYVIRWTGARIERPENASTATPAAAAAAAAAAQSESLSIVAEPAIDVPLSLPTETADMDVDQTNLPTPAVDPSEPTSNLPTSQDLSSLPLPLANNATSTIDTLPVTPATIGRPLRLEEEMPMLSVSMPMPGPIPMNMGIGMNLGFVPMDTSLSASLTASTHNTLGVMDVDTSPTLASSTVVL